MSARKSVVTALIAVLAVAAAATPAAAKYKVRHERKNSERADKELFGEIPKGPLQIFISIDQQKLHLYSDGIHVADTSVATGVLSLPTPLGVFSVIQKQVFHRSNLYSNAPMPFMQRITWSGVALHEGESIGHRASHGCIRMPHDFAVRLYHLTKLGVAVVIADPELKPAPFADPHLFVHREKPPAEPAFDADKLGLRIGNDIAATPGGNPAPSDRPSNAAPAAATPALFGAPVAPVDAATPGPQATVAANAPVAGQAKADPVAADAAATAPPAAVHASDAPASVAAAAEMPLPPAMPGPLAKEAPAKSGPVAIFISRKEKKIYVRQDFTPLFDAPVGIADPAKPLGTHVFTALGFIGDDRTVLRWDAVSLPGEPPKAAPRPAREERYDRYGRLQRRDRREAKIDTTPPPTTAAEALARIDIPQEAVDYISRLIVPGSSLIVSDQGLGDETGEGTNFVVVTR